MHHFRRVCVYCGSSLGHNKDFQRAAKRVGHVLATNSMTLVYGGGNIGLMKEVADGVLEGGGRVIGVIPRKLMELELAHPNLQELYITDSMHQRKYLMAQLSDAFIALPGGWGTLEELAEITTWAQLNYHHKAIGLLNLHGYYDSLLAWINHANEQGFIADPHVKLMAIHDDPEKLIEGMKSLQFPDLAETLNIPKHTD